MSGSPTALLPYYSSNTIECGLDEAGRGCIAGPVVAAAVIWPPTLSLPLLNDSKQLTEAQRFDLEPLIKAQALAWAVAEVSAAEIDEINILQASIKAMHLAVDQIMAIGTGLVPELLLVDGNRFRPYPFLSHVCLVKGDARFLSIAAASVLAKTHRDRLMVNLAAENPGYGWEHNMGYPTPMHKLAVARLGFTPYHRLTFRMEIGKRVKKAN